MLGLVSFLIELMHKKEVNNMKIAILGYGTVGKGLVEIIEGNKNKRNIKNKRREK